MILILQNWITGEKNRKFQHLVRRKKDNLSVRKKKKVQKKKEGIKPILGVHTKYSVKVMEEIQPPFDKKTQKKLRGLRYKK